MSSSILQYLALEPVFKQTFNEAIYKAVEPIPYPNSSLLKQAALNVGRVLFNKEPNDFISPYSTFTDKRKRAELIKLAREEPEKYQQQFTHEDAWRLYLGLPQITNALEESLHKPSKSQNSDIKYFRAKNGWKDLEALMGGIEGIVRFLDINKVDKKVTGGPFYLGNFTLSRSQDEKGHYLSYYDKYDFDVPGSGLVGKPFEIYDRIYYDPKTFKPIEPKTPEIDVVKTRKLISKLFGANNVPR